jgi:hypothetical protein
MKAILPALLIATAILAQGCFVYHYPSTPDVSGIVVDGSTRIPITNAIVGFRDHRKTFTQTAIDGSFHVLFGKKWGPAFIMRFEFTPCQGTFSVNAKGYQPFEEWLGTSPGYYKPIALTNPIALQRISN